MSKVIFGIYVYHYLLLAFLLLLFANTNPINAMLCAIVQTDLCFGLLNQEGIINEDRTLRLV